MIDVIGSEKVVYIYIYFHHFRPENSDHMHYQKIYQEKRCHEHGREAIFRRPKYEGKIPLEQFLVYIEY